jgi:hypothetical protein
MQTPGGNAGRGVESRLCLAPPIEGAAKAGEYQLAYAGGAAQQVLRLSAERDDMGCAVLGSISN